ECGVADKKREEEEKRTWLPWPPISLVHPPVALNCVPGNYCGNQPNLDRTEKLIYYINDIML
ncbi:MAG: hypothetical protein ABSF43_18195, partial [Rectinemataceae bacterium]